MDMHSLTLSEREFDTVTVSFQLFLKVFIDLHSLTVNGREFHTISALMY